jgi:hypothetical protein
MNDMQALDRLGAALDPAGDIPPARLRHRVMRMTSRPSRSPRLRRLVLVGGLAVVVTAGGLAVQVVRVGDRPPASTASASEILRAAAAQARHRAAVTVRDDQFVYVDSLTMYAVLEEDGSKPAKFESSHREVWLSVGGERDSLLRSVRDGRQDDNWVPGCRNGQETQTKGDQTVTQACTPVRAYQADLPTDAGAMLAFLYRGATGESNPRDQEAFTAAGDLIREAYIRPASLAAVFDALARIPGVTVVGDVTDRASRHGVAVALTEVQGVRTELIFDKQSHAFLGERIVAIRDQDGLKAGDIVGSTAVLTATIVDTAGQRQ